jgi:hypothetical protein
METRQQFIDRKWTELETVYIDYPPIPIRVLLCWQDFWGMVKVNKEIK